MFSETWFWLFLAVKVLGATCPFTSPIGSILGLISMIARYVFIGMLFFLAPEWWYGLVMLAVEWFAPVVIPRINPEEMRRNGIGMLYSSIGSHIAPLIVILVYLFFFKVI